MTILSDPSPTLPDEQPMTPAPPARAKDGGGLFRAFWRWHFYASALVIPVFLVLSLTGLVMLFKWQLDPLQTPAMRYDPPAYGIQKSLSLQEQAVLEAFPGSTVTALQTSAQDRSTYFTITTAQGDTRNVYVNPVTAAVQGAVDPRDQWSNIATEIHGMLIFGKISDIELFNDKVAGATFTTGSIGDRLIELASCWGVVMALTGYYLWWRGRPARDRLLRKAAPGAKTRSRHAKVGAWIGVGILLLVITGLPWTGMWGARVQAWATGSSLSLWGEDPGAKSNLAAHLDQIGSSSVPAPWAEGQSPLPSSDSSMAGMPGMAGAAGSGPADGQVGIDWVVQRAMSDGVQLPVYVAYPSDKEGVFSVMSDMWHDKASAAYDNVGQERVVHIDQYSGQIAGRYSYAEYAPAAKLVSQGIAIHEGQRFGTLNFWGSAAFCVSVIVLCVTGPMMWWRRRRASGGIAAPKGRMPVIAKPVLAVALVALGIVMPLFGASLVLVLLLDRLVVARSAKWRQRLNSA